VTRTAAVGVARGSGRRLRTRARLIEAARRIVATRGIEATPISEITDEAGVGVGSFYNHFATKEELLEAVISDTFEAHGAALDRIHEGKDDIAEIVAQNIRLTVRMVDHDPLWGWFAVRTGLYAPQLQSSLGGRLERDLRRGFDAGRFAEQFGDEGHRQGYCLYKLGCKGPETFNNCPTQTFNDVGASAWPVGMGAPCFGCSEEGVGFTAPLHSPARPIYVTPPALFPGVDGGAQGKATTGGALVGGAVIGAVVGAGIATAKKTAKKAEEES